MGCALHPSQTSQEPTPCRYKTKARLISHSLFLRDIAQGPSPAADSPHWTAPRSSAESSPYYTRAGKARTADDHQKSFGAWIIYELPIGKGQRWLNRGGILNAIVGGWKLDVSENILSGIPITVGYSGSPNRYLTATRVNALVPTDRAKTPNWTMGEPVPNRGTGPLLRHERIRKIGRAHV